MKIKKFNEINEKKLSKKIDIRNSLTGVDLDKEHEYAKNLKITYIPKPVELIEVKEYTQTNGSLKLELYFSNNGNCGLYEWYGTYRVQISLKEKAEYNSLEEFMNEWDDGSNSPLRALVNFYLNHLNKLVDSEYIVKYD